MKRAIALIIITLMMAAILGCGGGSGSGQISSGTSTVKIAIAGLAKGGAHFGLNAQSAAVANIQFTISAPDMDTITRTVAVTGDTITESFVVPNGSNRHFLVVALASDNTTVLSQGDAFSDLDGTPKDIDVVMGVNIAGEWTFTFIGQAGNPVTDFITFTQVGNSLTLSGTTASASILKSVLTGNGTVTGNDIQFIFNGTGCGNASTVAVTGTFNSAGGIDGTFTLTGGCGNDSGTSQAVQGHITPPPANGSVSGTVTDAQTTAPLSEVAVKLFQQGSLITSGTTGSDGTYSLTAPAGSGYSIAFSKTSFTTKTVDNITVASNATTTVDAALSSTPPPQTHGSVSGTVTDALGQPLAGVTVRLLSGSTVIATTTNIQDGTYSITGPPGTGYTVEFSKTGFITSTVSNITIIDNTTTGNVNMALSPTLQEGQTRIVLTWGVNPADLDSHLTGPIPNSSQRFHIYYNADCYPSDTCTLDNAGNTIPGPNTDAVLDHDTTEHGPDVILEPETTTIVQQFSGVYRFSVRDFTNGGEGTTSTALSNSGAQVNVYQGNSLVATFNVNVPPNRAGDLWTVFELNGNTITPINTMTFVSDETTIQSASGKAGLKKTKTKSTKR